MKEKLLENSKNPYYYIVPTIECCNGKLNKIGVYAFSEDDLK